MVTLAQLKAIMPLARERAERFLPWINATIEEFGIRDVPMFLAQLAHESGQLRYVEEIASGAAYDTGKLARILGNTPEADGDGQKFKGHGLIQITGTDNHRKVSRYFFGDNRLLHDPSWLMTDEGATRGAGWFWKVAHDLDGLTLEECTRKINGGQNGLEDRRNYHRRAMRAFK